MITYKLFREKNGNLYPLYVNADDAIAVGEWLKSKPGTLVDDTHVKAKGCGGKLRLRSGYHSTMIPFTDWIGEKQPDGTLAQRKDCVWCECEVKGNEIESKTRTGYDIVPDNSYYFFKTNSKQVDPWIISDWIRVNRKLTNEEVAEICRANGVEPQKVAM
jgi:hypothetical protein